MEKKPIINHLSVEVEKQNENVSSTSMGDINVEHNVPRARYSLLNSQSSI